MYLEANTLFDNRYQLIEQLGQGASAQVWLANDTLTGNLRVAIKIFNGSGDIDDSEEENFKKEFKTVYNIIHQNLLTPTNYSVNNGIPYLVMPYCENGSISSMVGRCDENDVIKLLHDVAAGLDQLHQYGIIHQDIKPDNIMVDNDLNYLITDFGISAGNDDDSTNYGGTRAYMAPERFNGVSDKRGDVWSLGATAYEMLSGNPPFGDHGGIVQSQGEKIHKIDGVQLQPEVANLIESMLDYNPDKRPTPKDIFYLTDRYLRTGTWKEASAKRYYRTTTIVVAIIAIIAGIFIFDKFRTKTYYYRDYVEHYGVPQPIGEPLTGSQHRGMRQCYRFEYRNGKLHRLSFVNSKDKVIGIRDIEANNLRFPEQEFEYDGNGNLSEIIVKDQFGKKLYKIIYRLSDDKSTAIAEFKYPVDSKNVSKYYSGNTSDGKEDVKAMSRRGIIEMRMTYNDKGQLIKREYLSGEDQRVADANGIFGQEISYDEVGRIVSVRSINENGSLAGDATGVAERRYTYNTDGFLESISYLGFDGSPARDAVNRSAIKFEYAEGDDSGNSIREIYTDGNNNPIPRSSDGAYGYSIENTDDGLVASFTLLGPDGNAHINKDGYDRMTFKVNSDGFDAETRYYHGDKLVLDADGTAGYNITYNSDGLPLDTTWIDINGNKLRHVAYDYDDNSVTRTEYNDSGAFVIRKKDVFNELGQIDFTAYFNENGDTIENPRSGVAVIRYNYEKRNHQILTISRFALGGKPVNDLRTGFSSEEFSNRDNEGRISYIQFVDKDRRLVDFKGFAKIKFEYNDSSENISRIKGVNQYNQEILTIDIEYDQHNQPIIRGRSNYNMQSFGPVKFVTEYNTDGIGSSLTVQNGEGKEIDLVLPNGARGCHIKQIFDNGKLSYVITNTKGETVSAPNDYLAGEMKNLYYLINSYICRNNTTICTILKGLSAKPELSDQQAESNEQPSEESMNSGSDRQTTSQSAPEPAWMEKVRREASNCPRQIDDGIVMRRITCTTTSVRITIALKYFSGANDRRDELLQEADYYTSMPHRQWGVPSNVNCHVTIYDKNNSVIYQN